MCDYSLHLVASRAAKVGDELVTTKFDNSLTRGFAAIGEPNVAVCLLPGTEVVCQSAPERDPRSASKRDPFERRVLAVALAPSELVGVAETARARVVGA